MPRQPVLTKKDMYERIERGEFGNTLPRWYDWEKWTEDANGRDKYELWAVQSRTKAGDPRAKLNVHRADVYEYIHSNGLAEDGYVISCMVIQVGRLLWEGNVELRANGPNGGREIAGPGLHCEGHLSPAPGTWRQHMQHPDVWDGLRATHLLRTVLNENSYDDVMELLDLYPDHVIEFTALDVVFGTHPDRNAVLWEVRRY